MVINYIEICNFKHVNFNPIIINQFAIPLCLQIVCRNCLLLNFMEYLVDLCSDQLSTISVSVLSQKYATHSFHLLLSCLGKLHDHTTDYFERRLKNVPIDLATLCAELIVCNGMCKPKKNETKQREKWDLIDLWSVCCFGISKSLVRQEEFQAF